jgi:hypothetical protein
VAAGDTIGFDVTSQPPSVAVRSRWITASVPLDGSPASFRGTFQTVVAAIDAGWLKLTMTQPRNGGFANVMQEVYILNRDRTELTVWRTLNTVTPDGSSGKIDCGNRAAIVFTRRPNAK